MMCYYLNVHFQGQMVNHYMVLKPKSLSSQKIKDIEIETQLFWVWITGFPPAPIERLSPTLQT